MRKVMSFYLSDFTTGNLNKNIFILVLSRMTVSVDTMDRVLLVTLL